MLRPYVAPMLDEVGLLARIRETSRFPSAEELKRQLERDLNDVRGIANRQAGTGL